LTDFLGEQKQNMKKTKFCEQKHKNNYFQKAGGGHLPPPK